MTSISNAAPSTPITQKVIEILETDLSGNMARRALNSISNAPLTSLTEIHARRSDIGGALEALDIATCSVMTKTVLREVLVGLRQVADQSLRISRHSKPPVPQRPPALAAYMPPKARPLVVETPSFLGILNEQQSRDGITDITLKSLVTAISHAHGVAVPGTEGGPNSIDSLQSALRELKAAATGTAVANIQHDRVRAQVSETLKAMKEALQDEIHTLEAIQHAHPDKVIRAFEAWFEANAAGPSEWEIITGITDFFLARAPHATHEAS